MADERPPDPVRSWMAFANQHLALLATVAFAALVATRVLSVARGQPRTATVLLSSSPGQVGLATLVTALPFLLYLAAAAFAVASSASTSPLRRRRNALLIVVLVFLGFGASPLFLAVISVPSLVLAARPVREGRATQLLGRLMLRGLEPEDRADEPFEERIADIKRRARQGPAGEVLDDLEHDVDNFGDDVERHKEAWVNVQDKVTVRALTLAGLVSLPIILWFLFFVVSDRMWVPLEVVTTDDRQIVGYVIQEGEWMAVMADDDRNITRVRNADVDSRAICQPQARRARWLAKPPLAVLWSKNSPEYPACSDLLSVP